MSLRDQMAADLGAFAADASGLSESLSYMAVGATRASAIRGLIEMEESQWRDLEDGETEAQGATVWIRAADISDPRLGDQIAYGGESWRVVGVAQNMAPGLHRLRIERSESKTRGRESYRLGA